MPPAPPVQPPSLLLSASFHRSGSTLLQRYVTAVSDVFVWGENGWLIDSVRTAWEEWPGEAHNERERRKVMSDPSTMQRRYVPNLAPSRDRVLDAFRLAMTDIYRDRPEGFARWGWKAVRYGRAELDFVRRLFPDIVIVLLVRNPWDVARSVRRKGWIDRRGYFEDVAQVARHWAERTAYYAELAGVADERVHLVQYEQLEDRLAELDAFLGVQADPAKREEILSRRLGAAPVISRYGLTAEDVETIGDIAGNVASGLGYAPPPIRCSRVGAAV